jgi:NAD(P)-dependent dehydrogenase (short-subunit alcohol dehydrogenase family)
MRTQRLANKTALITGATRGLGLEIARLFAREGASLALVGHDPPALEAAQRVVRSACETPGQQVRAYEGDLRDQKQVDELAWNCLRDLRQIDILVNNAAVQGPIGKFEQNDWNAWRPRRWKNHQPFGRRRCQQPPSFHRLCRQQVRAGAVDGGLGRRVER